ncbi:MAG: methionyl-tRNA formyltransferase [Lachnospiraceae bacterium]|nr:methionyl-tRNA formyltransferase [Lachnospiraceae bacterium]
MKVIFMGTPDFAAGILESIVRAGHEVLLAVTQCDKPKGRGKAMQYPPVKEKALEYGIPVYQPEKIKKEECVEELNKYEPDIIIVAAYGQILPKSILEMAKYGCVNVHASLLPKYRGAAPIQWAIIDGEQQTGVTTMMMDVGLDTGDMIDKALVDILPEETGGSLFDKLMGAGQTLILETMEKLEQGRAVLTKQDDSQSSYAKMLTKELGKIDFSQPAIQIERLVRGLNPWPSAYTSFRGKNLKIWKSFVIEKEMEGAYGEIVEVTKDYFAVKTGEYLLGISELQMEGKKRMDTRAFLAGVKVETGEKLEF